MTNKMPDMDVTFQQLATSLIDRSERGIAILILKDVTAGAVTYAEYADITAASEDQALYTTENYQYIEDIFSYALNKVVVVNMGAAGTVAAALTTISNNVSTGWITIADGVQADFDTLSSWIKSKELLKKSYKAVCYKATTTDCKHTVNFYNDSVTFVDSDGRGKVTGEKICPLLIGVLASCNILRGSTYFKITALKTVEEVADNNAAIAAGKFILFNDGADVRVALGINSMVTTNGTTATTDMQFIEIVEAMDLINDDITSVFKDTYLGAYKNKYDNQMLLISAINGYFKTLADSDVLDSEYSNIVDVDVATQRAAWVASGTAAAATWADVKVKNMTYKMNVYLAGDAKILGSMTNLNFGISLA